MFKISECAHHFLIHKTEIEFNKQTWKSLISWYISTKISLMFCEEFQIFKTVFLKLILDNSFFDTSNLKSS